MGRVAKALARNESNHVNSSTHLALFLTLRPAAWLGVLVSLYFSSNRRAGLLEKGGFGKDSQKEDAFQYKPVAIFALCELLGGLAQLLVGGYLFPVPFRPETILRLQMGISWVFYAVAIYYAFGIIAALVSNALEQFPDLIRPARVMVRCLAALVMVIALAAHIPLTPGHTFTAWLLDARVSCNVSLFFFEAGLFLLFCLNLRRLGLSLRSRAMGLAFGLLLFGASDIVWSVAAQLSTGPARPFAFWSETLILFGVALWSFYIMAPEPPRLAHTMGRETVLMTWQQLAAQLKENRGAPIEKSPFIATIESRVEAVLARHGFKGA
jgi:hypothetical protein